MPLMTIEKFIENEFDPDSRPDGRTILKLLKNNEFPFFFKKIGKKYYIDPARESSVNNNKRVQEISDRILNNG